MQMQTCNSDACLPTPDPELQPQQSFSSVAIIVSGACSFLGVAGLVLLFRRRSRKTARIAEQTQTEKRARNSRRATLALRTPFEDSESFGKRQPNSRGQAYKFTNDHDPPSAPSSAPSSAGSDPATDQSTSHVAAAAERRPRGTQQIQQIVPVTRKSKEAQSEKKIHRARKTIVGENEVASTRKPERGIRSSSHIGRGTHEGGTSITGGHVSPSRRRAVGEPITHQRQASMAKLRASVRAVGAAQAILSTVNVVMEGCGATLSFRMPASKHLRKMLKIWSERQGLEVGAQFTYRYYGREVGPLDTPESLGMVEGEIAVIKVSMR